MRVSRAFVGLAGVLVAVSAIGHRSADAAATSPSVNIRRVAFATTIVFPGDFNGDGIPDLVGTQPWVDGPPPAVIALGKGDGTYGPATPINCFCRILAVADLNRDGKLDLVVEEEPEPDVTIFALRGNGDGTFSTSGIGQDWRVGQASAVSTGIVGDVNGDGKPDVILVTNQDGPQLGEFVQVVPGNGDMSFQWTAPTMLPATSIPSGLAIGDLNGDGRTDIATANRDGRSLSVFLNQGAFSFTTTADIALDRDANDILIADVNRDGKMDLAVAATSDGADGLFHIDGYVYILQGNGNGTFGAAVKYQTDNGAVRIVRADLNRDGIPDLATANDAHRKAEDYCGFYSDTVSILPGNADGTFAAASSFALGNQSDPNDTRFRQGPGPLSVADVNRDGFADLLTGSGAIVINRAPDPNWAPTVTATATNPDATHSITLRTSSSDVDQDALTFAWSESGGQPIEPTPAPCTFTPTTGGTHTFTVTVDDHNGHTASSSVTVDFGSIGGGGGTPPAVSVTAPAAGAILDEAKPFTITWTAASSATLSGVSVSLSTDDGGHFQSISECASLPGSATSCTWSSVEPVTSFGRIKVVASDNAGLTGTGISGRFTVRAAPGGGLPYGWSHADVGFVGAAGSASHDGFIRDGQGLTVTGSGGDIWGTADAFHFVWQHVAGDFSIDARVDSLQNTNVWAKAGLMVRANATDPQSTHASIFVSPSKGIVFQRRTAHGGVSASTQGPLVAAPVWLRITRNAMMITALYRKNTTDAWTVLGRQVFDSLAGAVDVGLPVTSHAAGTLATAKFSGVFLQRLPETQFRAFPMGGATGSLSINGDSVTVRASGADIWNAQDSFVFFAVPMGDNSEITVRVRSLGNTNAWAKAGVMIRESSAPGSKHADAIVSPGKGIAMQYRSATNGATASAAQVAAGAPIWLRIRRSESATPGGPSSFQATYSTDMQLWRILSNSVSFPIAHDALIGIALTSHAAGVETTAIVDDIRIEP